VDESAATVAVAQAPSVDDSAAAVAVAQAPSVDESAATVVAEPIAAADAGVEEPQVVDPIVTAEAPSDIGDIAVADVAP
jgi:hypothetical protein